MTVRERLVLFTLFKILPMFLIFVFNDTGVMCSLFYCKFSKLRHARQAIYYHLPFNFNLSLSDYSYW